MTSDIFSYLVDIRSLAALAQPILLEATPGQCADLAARFGLGSIEALSATVTVTSDARGVRVRGQVQSDLHYLCRVSREPFASHVTEPMDILLVQGVTEDELPSPEESAVADDPVELLPLEGSEFDIAMLAAETLALALDPFPRGPEADKALKQLGIQTEEEAQMSSSPFAVLAKSFPRP
jgi:uncharacterized metal-binding protein YceD (DUF177 family)